MSKIENYVKQLAGTSEKARKSKSAVVRNIDKAKTEGLVSVEYLHSEFNPNVANSAFMEDVKVVATISDNNKLIVPSIGSEVIVSFEEFNNGFISMFSSITEIVNIINKSSVSIEPTRIVNKVGDSKIEVYEDSIKVILNNKDVMYVTDIVQGQGTTTNTFINSDYIRISNESDTLGNIYREMLDILNKIINTPVTNGSTISVGNPDIIEDIIKNRGKSNFIE